jgi:hypothetical protein
MKSYHSIPHWNKGIFGEKCIAQLKNDGSNMRFEWNKNSGFYKFGTKNAMIGEKDENFGDGIFIFLEKYNEDLNRMFRDKFSKVINFVVFGEYFGDNSFAGQHLKSDKKDVKMFDVSVYKHGIMNPYEFLDNFGHLDIPKVIYEGEYNMKFINDVRNDIYGLDEGVVCKGVFKTKKDGSQIWMSKIKTNLWLRKVKEKMGDKALLEELNGDKNLFELCK